MCTLGGKFVFNGSNSTDPYFVYLNRMPFGGESRCQEPKREDQMVEHRCSTKQEPEESQDSNMCSSVSEIVTVELQCKANLSSSGIHGSKRRVALLEKMAVKEIK